MTESYPCKRLRHDWSHHPDAGLPRRCFNCLAQQRPVENKSRSAAYDYRYVFTHDKLGNPVEAPEAGK